MTNEEYRQLRGTENPFAATPEQSKETWYAVNKTVIDARRKRDESRVGKRWQRKDNGHSPALQGPSCV